MLSFSKSVIFVVRGSLLPMLILVLILIIVLIAIEFDIPLKTGPLAGASSSR